MRVSYKGRTKDYDYRIAEVSFNEEKEQEIFDRVVFFMERVKEYTVDCVTEGYAICEVCDKEEFEIFAKEWREATKMVKNCMKFGF